MKTNNPTPNNNSKSGSDRNDTRKHQYRDHDEVLTNDENYDVVCEPAL